MSPEERLDALRKAPPDGWVAFSSDETRLVAYGVTYEEAVRKADENGEGDPVLVKVPRDWSMQVLWPWDFLARSSPFLSRIQHFPISIQNGPPSSMFGLADGILHRAEQLNVGLILVQTFVYSTLEFVILLASSV
jgi:hypothetical protein